MGITPRLRPAMRDSSRSTQMTSLPKSEKPLHYDASAGMRVR